MMTALIVLGATALWWLSTKRIDSQLPARERRYMAGFNAVAVFGLTAMTTRAAVPFGAPQAAAFTLCVLAAGPPMAMQAMAAKNWRSSVLDAYIVVISVVLAVYVAAVYVLGFPATIGFTLDALTVAVSAFTYAMILSLLRKRSSTRRAEARLAMSNLALPTLLYCDYTVSWWFPSESVTTRGVLYTALCIILGIVHLRLRHSDVSLPPVADWGRTSLRWWQFAIAVSIPGTVLSAGGSGVVERTPAGSLMVCTTVACILLRTIAALGEQERLYTLLTDRETEFANLVKGSLDVVGLCREGDMVVLYASPASRHILGVPQASLLDKPLTDALSCSALDASRLAAVAGGDGTETHIDFDDKVVSVALSPHPEGYVFRLRDVTERARLDRKLTDLAYRDDLTGLPSRHAVNEHLTRACESGGDWALLFIDLDRFKPINDTFGHAIGDALLREVAVRLRQHSTHADFMGRLGGDEFVVAVSPAARAHTVATELVSAISAPYVIAGRVLRLSASIGTAVAREGVTAADMLTRSDTAMYQAKSKLQSQDNLARAAAVAISHTDEEHIGLAHSTHKAYWQRVCELNGAVMGYRVVGDHDLSLTPAAFAEHVSIVPARMRLWLPTSAEDLADYYEAYMAVLAEQSAPDRVLHGVTLSLRSSPTLHAFDVIKPAMEALCDVGVDFELADAGSGYAFLEVACGLPFTRLQASEFVLRSGSIDPSRGEVAALLADWSHHAGLIYGMSGVDNASSAQFARSVGAHYVTWDHKLPIPAPATT